MDVKGITWVGNIYQKFESMCLEVEEIMYEDTVKYVENQVQTVGANVKKFYSDVMEDLLSPSSFDPEKKVSTCGFAIEQNSDNGVNKKTNASKKEKPVKTDVQQSTEGDNDMVHSPLFLVHHNADSLCKPSSGNWVNKAFSDECSRSDSDRREYSSSKWGVEVNLNASDKTVLTEASCPVTYIQKEFSTESSWQCDLSNENHESSYDQTDATAVQSLGESTKCYPKVEICDVIENESQFTSSNGLSAESKIFSNSEIVFVGGSSQNVEIQYDKCVDDDVCLSHPGESFHWCIGSIENNAITENGIETVQQTDEAKLEETCVVVSGDELHFVPQREEKCRNYKKKIGEAFSRMQSARKMEYKQLALLYGDVPKLNQECREVLTQNLTTNESKRIIDDKYETEWELL